MNYYYKWYLDINDDIFLFSTNIKDVDGSTLGWSKSKKLGSTMTLDNIYLENSSDIVIGNSVIESDFKPSKKEKRYMISSLFRVRR